MNKFLLLCVNYQNDVEVLAFVRTVLSMDGTDRIRVVVADNTVRVQEARDGFEASLSVLGAKVASVSTNTNLGYFGGLNAAMRRGREQFGDIKFEGVVLANTDIEFPRKDFFDQLDIEVNRVVADNAGRAIGLIVPSIQSSRTGKNQNPLYWHKPKRKKFEYLSAIYSMYPLGVLHRLLAKVKGTVFRRAIRGGSRAMSSIVYAGHGSFMVLLDEFFTRGGHLEYPEFLFCEEIFVAEQCVNLQLTAVFVPDLKVIHREHATTGLIPSRKIIKYLQRSHQFCKNNYF
ncbi:hypothetical protein [Paraburkholderia fynbosensis]|uniref:Glycosyltransferase 2-like domain-containing protein n=1 Tax=Paraburkholderia fynbosensis TaxID=1200993 RepID=A0A6J5GDK2_9BURK|nr:hypothetical protein [Paraburkholderia fynbosensis]CAB3794740.1 hypothetical protein LMG27177_03736 [Paraburkholderia fynbosensis]